MGDKFLKSLWDQIKSKSDDEYDSDETFCDIELPVLKENYFQKNIESNNQANKSNASVHSPNKDKGNLKCTGVEQATRHNLNEYDRESWFNFTEIEQNDRESYFGFTDLDALVHSNGQKYDETISKKNILTSTKCNKNNLYEEPSLNFGEMMTPGQQLIRETHVSPSINNVITVKHEKELTSDLYPENINANIFKTIGNHSLCSTPNKTDSNANESEKSNSQINVNYTCEVPANLQTQEMNNENNIHILNDLVNYIDNNKICIKIIDNNIEGCLQYQDNTQGVALTNEDVIEHGNSYQANNTLLEVCNKTYSKTHETVNLNPQSDKKAPCKFPAHQIEEVNNENDAILNDLVNYMDNSENRCKTVHSEIENCLQYKQTTEVGFVSKDINECSNDTFLEGLSQNLQNITEGPERTFLGYNSNIPLRKPCSPPLSLCTEPRRKILPADKKLPKYNSLPAAKKVLPTRKCTSKYLDDKQRLFCEDKENIEKREISQSSSDEEVTFSKDKCNKDLENKSYKNNYSNQTKKPTQKYIKKHKRGRKKKQVEESCEYNKLSKEDPMRLDEVEERLRQTELKVAGWVSGVDPNPPTREQAFQMLTDTKSMIIQLQTLLEKKQFRKKTECKDKERKTMSALLERSNQLAITIDSAILEADRLMEMEQGQVLYEDEIDYTSSPGPHNGNRSFRDGTSSPGVTYSPEAAMSSIQGPLNKNTSKFNFVIRTATFQNNLKTILKNSSSENSTENSTKHISFSDDVEYRYMSCSDQSAEVPLETNQTNQIEPGCEEIGTIAHMISLENSFQSKLSIGNSSLSHEKLPELSLEDKLIDSVSHLKGELENKNYCNPVLKDTESTDSKGTLFNSAKVNKEVQTMIADSSEEISLESINKNDKLKNILTSDKQPEICQKKLSTCSQVLLPTPTPIEVIVEYQCSVQQSSDNFNNSKIKSDSNKIDQQSRMDWLQNESTSLSQKHTPEQSKEERFNTKTVNELNKSDINDKMSCGSVSSKADNSFNFTESEENEESWLNISIMNVKAIRVKDPSELIAMSNESTDTFQSYDWFEDLEDWGGN